MKRIGSFGAVLFCLFSGAGKTTDAWSLLRSALWGLVLILIVNIPITSAMDLAAGDLYSSNYFSNTINHYTSIGVYLDSMTLSSTYGSQVKGLSFGQNGLLYAVTARDSGFGVVALDKNGAVQETYAGSSYISGDLGYGKIAFSKNGQFFVAAGANVVAFTPGTSFGSSIYTNNSVTDVVSLPSGNLLVLSAYDLKEITTTGSVVRSIIPSISLSGAQGVEYDPSTNDIFVTMNGYTGQYDRIMRIDSSTGQVEVNNYFWYPSDMILTSDNRLIVGSRTQAPGIFDLNLNQIGSLTANQQMFVTQMPSAVPEPASAILLVYGAAFLIGASWRSRNTMSRNIGARNH